MWRLAVLGFGVVQAQFDLKGAIQWINDNSQAQMCVSSRPTASQGAFDVCRDVILQPATTTSDSACSCRRGSLLVWSLVLTFLFSNHNTKIHMEAQEGPLQHYSSRPVAFEQETSIFFFGSKQQLASHVEQGTRQGSHHLQFSSRPALKMSTCIMRVPFYCQDCI